MTLDGTGTGTGTGTGAGAGHGTLAAFHDGCRCCWCVSVARERGCRCKTCRQLRATSPYVEAPREGRGR